MAESPKIPLSIALPALPHTPDECPAWAARVTAALAQMYRRLATQAVSTTSSGASTTPAFPALTRFDVGGTELALPATAPAASPPTFLSIAKWCDD